MAHRVPASVLLLLWEEEPELSRNMEALVLMSWNERLGLEDGGLLWYAANLFFFCEFWKLSSCIFIGFRWYPINRKTNRWWSVAINGVIKDGLGGRPLDVKVLELAALAGVCVAAEEAAAWLSASITCLDWVTSSIVSFSNTAKLTWITVSHSLASFTIFCNLWPMLATDLCVVFFGGGWINVTLCWSQACQRFFILYCE